MPLIPLNIPAGQYRNGTEYQSQGRWRDGNLIRWHEGALRPIGGWRQRGTVDIDGVARTIMAWESNDGSRRVAFGTHNKLYAMTSSNTISDITPVGFTSGRVDATALTGYGGAPYSGGLYGLPSEDTGSILRATTWSLENWGEYLLGTTADDGKIYEWQTDSATPAAVLSNAPTGCTGMMVTEERFVFAFGAGGNPRNIAFSDREDNNTWTPAATNEAGDIDIQTNGVILKGLRTRGQALILTDQDAHTATYSGPPFVYGFERVGTSCGLIAVNAAASVDAGVIWMGLRSFFLYSGGAVQDLPCEVSDYVFSDMNSDQRSKVSAVVNSRFNEIFWFYPSGSSIECDRYVSFDYAENIWTTGEIDRTAGVDRGVFRQPFWIAADGTLYEQEIGFNYDGQAPFAETGPIAIGVGEQVMAVRGMIPDEKTLGDVNATFKTRFYPTDTERDYGPYSMANPTSLRFTGRQVRMRVTGDAASDWRVGIMRLDAVAGGKR
tara:strand:- start:387 stop:1865 length:1479 start_codon:yes stop_codon:yes gene_type:complete